MGEDSPRAHELRPQVPGDGGNIAVAPGILPEGGGIDLEFHEMPNRGDGVAKEEARAFQCAEQVADHGKRTALEPGEEERRPRRLIGAPLNLGGFQIRIDFRLDAHELAESALDRTHSLKTAIAHFSSLLKPTDCNRWA